MRHSIFLRDVPIQPSGRTRFQVVEDDIAPHISIVKLIDWELLALGIASFVRVAELVQFLAHSSRDSNAQTALRHKNARTLDRLLGAIEGITPQKLDPRCTRNGSYAYIFHVDPKVFTQASTEQFIKAMNPEGIPNQSSYPPLHKLDVFQTGAYRERLCGGQKTEKHAFLQQEFPVTHQAAWESVWIPQPAPLGDEEDMYEIAAAIQKIRDNQARLP